MPLTEFNGRSIREWRKKPASLNALNHSAKKKNTYIFPATPSSPSYSALLQGSAPPPPPPPHQPITLFASLDYHSRDNGKRSFTVPRCSEHPAAAPAPFLTPDPEGGMKSELFSKNQTLCLDIMLFMSRHVHLITPRAFPFPFPHKEGKKGKALGTRLFDIKYLNIN